MASLDPRFALRILSEVHDMTRHVVRILALALASAGSMSAQPARNDYRDPKTWLCRPDREDACTVDLTCESGPGEPRRYPGTAIARVLDDPQAPGAESPLALSRREEANAQAAAALELAKTDIERRNALQVVDLAK